jgi:hypothetical protein
MSRTAIVTPSYPPDFERCKLLVESLAHCAPQLRHYLIIDRRDRAMFRVLESDRTTIIDSEDILSSTFVRLPMPEGYWFNWRGLPVRGWIVQQMRKIAIANVIDAENLVYVDSDTAFIRPFSEHELEVEGRLGLLDTDFLGAQTIEWTGIACRLLGLTPESVTPRGHVGNLICWRRENVLAMQRLIEDVHGTGWQQVIARQRTLRRLRPRRARLSGGRTASIRYPSDQTLMGSGPVYGSGCPGFFRHVRPAHHRHDGAFEGRHGSHPGAG